MDPFKFPAVLNTIFRNLDSKFLSQTCRLVNSTWNYECCKILQTKTINFTHWTQLIKFIHTFETKIPEISLSFKSFQFSSNLFLSAIENSAFGDFKNLHAALQGFVQSAGKDVLKLEVSLYPIYPEIIKNAMLQHHSWLYMYKYLFHMIYSHFPNVQQLKILLLLLNVQVPEDFEYDIETIVEEFRSKTLQKLKSISIEIVAHEDEEYEIQEMYGHKEILGGLMKTLLLSCTNLNSLICENDDQHTITTKRLISNSILDSVPLMNPQIQLLDFTLHVNEDDLKIMTDRNFLNLQYLRLDIDTNTMTESTLEIFFSRSCYSLKSLCITFSDPAESGIICPQFPSKAIMSMLNNLVLENFNGTLNFDKMPKLESLELSQCKLKGVFSSLSSIEHINGNVSSQNHDLGNDLSLKRLTIGNGCQLNFKDKTASKMLLLDVFPQCYSHLSSLNISHFNVPLSLLFQHCKKLKFLSILKCDEVNDQTVCGIRFSLLKSICNLGNIMEGSTMSKQTIEEMQANAKSMECLRESAFIGNLTDLQHLVIQGELSDSSVLFGITSCKRLESLKLYSSMLTWRGLELIKGALHDLTHFELIDWRT